MLPIVLDHVALAAPRIGPLLDRYRGDLGGTWVGEGVSPGMHWCQLRAGNLMTVELLEPARVAEHDFLARFLERHGSGPHHLTFKVADLAAFLPSVEAAGYATTGVDLRQDGWKEAFLLPQQATGIVVQLAQAAGPPSTPEPPGIPAPHVPRPALLSRIVHLVDSLAEAQRLFVGLLGGTVIDRSQEWLEVAWPGPGRILFHRPEPGSRWDAWLGGRPGRLGWLEYSVVDPGPLAGVEVDAQGLAWIPPEANHGVRLRLR